MSVFVLIDSSKIGFFMNLDDDIMTMGGMIEQCPFYLFEVSSAFFSTPVFDSLIDLRAA